MVYLVLNVGGLMPLTAEPPDKAVAEKMVAFRKVSILGLDISIRALSAKNITESEFNKLEALVWDITDILNNTKQHFAVTIL
jgi:hypothetical protein